MVSSSSLIKVGSEAGALGLVVQASFNIALYIVQSKAGFVWIERWQAYAWSKPEGLLHGPAYLFHRATALKW